MALPSLPGNRRNHHLWKESFHKSQHFDYTGGLPMLVGLEKPGIGGELLPGQKTQPKHSVYPTGDGGRTEPSWVALDKRVLSFDAYFEETVPEKREETRRIRKVKIYFYLEDDTMQVVEPKQKNSGLHQGTLITRRRVPLPPPNDDRFYNVHHLNIGQQMALYSRTFTVTDCDPFTRTFLTKLGVRLNAPASVPRDPHDDHLKSAGPPSRPYARRDALRQFLDHDGQVLCFCCVWDDGGELPREMALRYFLADDTVEIREVVHPNSGRDVAPKFLRRGKLPKSAAAVPQRQPGEVAGRTLLNVIGPRGRYVLDRVHAAGAVHEEFYKDCDLTVGGEVNVWGRRLIICDCDEFTKDYYRHKYGVQDFTPVRYKSPPAPRPANPVPPYNGFGSEEDSLSSCRGLLPKPPRKDFRQLLERSALEREALRFHARMATAAADPVDAERAFVICFYLYDDAVAVFETPRRNSGVPGGRFLERGRVRKPGGQASEPEYLSARDLYVGALLDLHGHVFRLVDADEFTLGYMERHAERFPKADAAAVLAKVRSLPEEKRAEVRRFLAFGDRRADPGVIPFEPFRDLLLGLGCGLSEHEAVTLGRRFAAGEDPEVGAGPLLAVAQHFLRKKSFESFPEMTRAFVHQDRRRTGRLSAKETWRICKGFPLPLVDDLLRALLDAFAEEEEVDYHALLKGIDWRENPAPRVLPDDILKVYGLDGKVEARGPAVRSVDLGALMEDVFSGASASADKSTNITN